MKRYIKAAKTIPTVQRFDDTDLNQIAEYIYANGKRSILSYIKDKIMFDEPGERRLFGVDYIIKNSNQGTEPIISEITNVIYALTEDELVKLWNDYCYDDREHDFLYSMQPDFAALADEISNGRLELSSEFNDQDKYFYLGFLDQLESGNDALDILENTLGLSDMIGAIVRWDESFGNQQIQAILDKYNKDIE